MMAALATLPEHWQRVLVMVYVEDQPYSEVAAALGVSVNAARSLAGRARAGMRRALTSTNDRTTLAA
jgi:DNA-directed RNA polymerase specialized sigma24 family protein